MSIVDRLEAKGIKLKGKRSGTIKTLCPNCSHTRKHRSEPCLSVDIDKGVYNCHNCEFKGGVIQREMKEYVKPPARLEKLSPKMISWFENERKISNNTLLRAGLTQSVEYMPQKSKEMPVICFNYYRGDELINVKYRSGAKDFKMVSGAELIFYNIDALKDEKECFIVEGEIDCLTLIECGIYNVVSVPNGASKGSMKLEYLDNCWSDFEDKERIYLLTDGDEAGVNLRTELSRRLGIDRCFKFQYPEGCKDVNEVLLKHGKEEVVNLIRSPEPFPVEGILGLEDMYDDVCSYYENGYPEGVKIGIAGFDDYLNIRTGQMTVVTGIPGSGKSEFTDYIMTKTAENHNWSWAVCSFENQPSSLHVTKLMEKFSGKAFGFRKDSNDRMSIPEFEKAAYMVDKYFHFININQVDVTLTGILSKAKELVLRKGIKGLLVDPWNYIEHKIPAGYSETQYISEALTEFRTFCLKYGVHGIIIAHPTKLQKEKSTGKYEVPTLYSVSGSAHFFNKTDNGLSVWRDFETNVVDVYIQKVRDSWLGKIGFTSFNYNTMTRQYLPMGN